MAHLSTPGSGHPQAASSVWLPLFILAAVATAVVAPMFFLGNASGHDFDFHLASWLDVAGQWREGTFFPRWAEWANWGFGEPRFVFYPPASWLAGAGLGSLLPWRAVPGSYIWLAVVFAGMSMWFLARESLTSRRAIVAAVFFGVNPYQLILIYYRSDFAELLASAFFPLLLLGTFRVIRGGWRGLPLLAVSFAAVWYTNAPAAVIATYSLSLLFAAGCIEQRSIRPLAPGAMSMIVGFGLAAFYILPAGYEQRWVQIKEVLAQNLDPSQNFLFTRATDPEFVLFNWKVSAIALGVMLVAGIFAVLAAPLRRNFPALWWMLLALGLASAVAMFPPTLVLWRHLPKLRFVQFPWRWLLPLGVVYAFFIAAAFRGARRGWIGVIVLFVATSVTATAMIRDTWWDSEDIPVLSAAINSGHGYEGTDEYTPIGCDRYALPGSVPVRDELVVPAGPAVPRVARVAPDGRVVPATGIRVHVDQWRSENRALAADSAQPVSLALRSIDYPAWKILVDRAPAEKIPLAETTQLSTHVPAGSHRIELRFESTWDRTAGAAISALTALGLILFAAVTRRRSAVT